MQTLKVLYNNNCTFITDIVNKFKDYFYIELYNYDSKQKKKVKLMMEDFGTLNLPLIIFQDENLKDIFAIWSENNPDWEKEILNKLNN